MLRTPQKTAVTEGPSIPDVPALLAKVGPKVGLLAQYVRRANQIGNTSVSSNIPRLDSVGRKYNLTLSVRAQLSPRAILAPS